MRRLTMGLAPFAMSLTLVACAVEVRDGTETQELVTDGGTEFLMTPPPAAGGAPANLPSTGGAAPATVSTGGTSTGSTASTGGTSPAATGGSPSGGTGSQDGFGAAPAIGGGAGDAFAIGGAAGAFALPPPVDVTTLPPSATNPPECPATAPENPVGDCLGLPIYLNCQWGDESRTYSCVCDWYHWLCI